MPARTDLSTCTCDYRAARVRGGRSGGWLNTTPLLSQPKADCPVHHPGDEFVSSCCGKPLREVEWAYKDWSEWECTGCRRKECGYE